MSHQIPRGTLVYNIYSKQYGITISGEWTDKYSEEMVDVRYGSINVEEYVRYLTWTPKSIKDSFCDNVCMDRIFDSFRDIKDGKVYTLEEMKELLK